MGHVATAAAAAAALLWDLVGGGQFVFVSAIARLTMRIEDSAESHSHT